MSHTLFPGVSELRSRISGVVLEPTDDGFAQEVFAWKTNIIHRPDVAVGAATPGDIVEAVRFARQNNLSVRVQATGHGAEYPVTSGVLIITKRLADVVIDADARVATIGAGAQWASVINAAAEYGLAPIAGSSRTVGVVGYLLGGGLGPLDRSHGFSSDYLRGLSVVTGDGDLVEATEHTNPDLFWALRGGKTGLGIVTSVRLALVPLATLYGGSLIYEGENVEPALRAWVDYTHDLPDDVSTSVAISNLPNAPMIPEPLRGRSVVSIRFAYPGDEETGQLLALPLRNAAPVYLDLLAQMPASQIGMVHNDPPDPGPSWNRGRLLLPIDQEFVTGLLQHVGPGKQTPFIATEVRLLGGATEADVASGSAVGGRASAYTLILIGAPDPALFDTVLPAVSDALFDTLAPWISPETNINFAGKIESPEHYASAWPAATFEKLAQIRERYDPSGVFA